MAAAGALIAYPPLSDAIWWISDSKPRSEMTSVELEEVRRRARETYLRMRERMAADPVYREARLEVGRRVKKNSRARNLDKPRLRKPVGRVKARSEMTPKQLAERHRRDRETRQRRRERMAADADYREAQLEVGRRASRNWNTKNRDKPEVIENRRATDRKRWRLQGEQIKAEKRASYVGERAEQIRAANTSWYAANREERRAYRKAQRAANGDAIRAREREWRRREYERDPIKFNERMKEWRARNPVKARAYVRASNIKRRRAAGAGGHFTAQEWLALVESFAGRCGYCGRGELLEADHRTPLSRGGSNTIDNIIPACRHCNRRKSRRTEVEFRALRAFEATNDSVAETQPGPDGSASGG